MTQTATTWTMAPHGLDATAVLVRADVDPDAPAGLRIRGLGTSFQPDPTLLEARDRVRAAFASQCAYRVVRKGDESDGRALYINSILSAALHQQGGCEKCYAKNYDVFHYCVFYLIILWCTRYGALDPINVLLASTSLFGMAKMSLVRLAPRIRFTSLPLPLWAAVNSGCALVSVTLVA